ncbi:MAG: hypothetical protein Q9169_004220 [Polycauliona sp. 2 TL-2023]
MPPPARIQNEITKTLANKIWKVRQYGKEMGNGFLPAEPDVSDAHRLPGHLLHRAPPTALSLRIEEGDSEWIRKHRGD